MSLIHIPRRWKLSNWGLFEKLRNRTPVTVERYIQAPPFFNAIIRAISASLESEVAETEEEFETENEEVDQDRFVSLEERCDPGWYRGVFLTQSKLSESDFEILHKAFKRGCFLEQFEVDRFEYEAVINGGHLLVEKLINGSQLGLELKRRLPKEFKGDVQKLREILDLLPETGVLDLTTGVPKSAPKPVLHKVLRWIQAFPPLHREIVNGQTVICAQGGCPNMPPRLPGVGFMFQGIEAADEKGLEISPSIVSIPTSTPLHEGKAVRHTGIEFRVLANEKVVQDGFEPKLDVNFASKKLVIESEDSRLEIIRHVKTLDRPYGSLEITSNQGQTHNLETQLSRAWWFAEHELLVFVTQADRVYSLKNGCLSHLGSITFSNYGIDCTVNRDASRLVISSLGPEFIDFRLGKAKEFYRFTLGEVPHEMWDDVIAKQYKPDSRGVNEVTNHTALGPMTEKPLAMVRWLENKQEAALLKEGIKTVAQLLALTTDEAKQKGALRDHDVDQIAWDIEYFLKTEYKFDEVGEIRERIWRDLEKRGWVGELGADSSYELPSIRNPKLLAAARLENQITGTYFEGSRLVLQLSSGLDVLLNSDFETQLIYVNPWTPNSFMQRRFNLSNR